MYSKENHSIDGSLEPELERSALRAAVLDPDIEKQVGAAAFPVSAYTLFRGTLTQADCDLLAGYGISGLRPGRSDQHCTLTKDFDFQAVQRSGLVRVICDPRNIGII